LPPVPERKPRHRADLEGFCKELRVPTSEMTNKIDPGKYEAMEMRMQSETLKYALQPRIGILFFLTM
jgi:hypothetical protein